MVNHDNANKNAAAPVAPAAIPGLTSKGASRRRIAGLGVGGVLMTVAGKHAMAADMACMSPSGALSGDLHTSHAPVACEGGKTPKWWSDRRSLLPSTIDSKTLFSDIFPTSKPVGNMTVYKVLEGIGNKGEDQVPALMLATWFNVTVAPAMITFLTTQAVKDMWANYDADGYYNHSATSKRWDGAELATYLSNTQV